MGLVTWGIPHHGGYLFDKDSMLISDGCGRMRGGTARSWRFAMILIGKAYGSD